MGVAWPWAWSLVLLVVVPLAVGCQHHQCLAKQRGSMLQRELLMTVC